MSIDPRATRPTRPRSSVRAVPISGPTRGRAKVGRADPVAPVVAVRETAAGPADDRRLCFSQLVDERLANAADVRHLRVFTHPHAVVHDSAEVLDEVSVDLRRDRADRFADQNLEA